MERVCEYNRAVVCDRDVCYHCGWDPEVAEERLVEITGERLFRVPFTGYCEVWAKTKREAAEKAEVIEQQFFAQYDYGDPVCVKKEEENELD